MTRNLFTFGLVALFSVGSVGVASAGGVDIRAEWKKGPIVVDGSASDWQGVPATYLEENNAAVAVASDAQFVYLLFRTNDRKWARAIKATGLTVYLDASGGKKKDTYVNFRGGPSREELMRGGQEDQYRGPEGFEHPEISQDQPPRDQMGDEPRLSCFIKDRITEKVIPINGDEGPSAAFDTSKGFYQYEMRIPLVKDSVRYYGVDAKPGAKLGLTLVWGDMSDMMQRRKEGVKLGLGGPVGGGGGGMGGGMGGPPGGGMGRPGGPGGMRGGMPKKQEVFLKTTLASAPK